MKDKNKKHRIYTRFMIPESGEVTLVFWSGRDIKDFQSEHPNYLLTYKSKDHPNDLLEAVRNPLFLKPYLTSKHISSF